MNRKIVYTGFIYYLIYKKELIITIIREKSGF